MAFRAISTADSCLSAPRNAVREIAEEVVSYFLDFISTKINRSKGVSNVVRRKGIRDKG